MDFNQVRYFLAVSDTLNFTRAAELCNVTQPALTQAIKRLEKELSGELINRNGRNTELTALGKTLRSHFQQIDQTRQVIKSTANAMTSGESSELNIGLMCTIGPAALGGLLTTFHQKHPDLTIVLHDVTPSSITDLLLSGAIDGAFCTGAGPQHTRLKYMDLFDEPIVVAFGQGHAFSELVEVPLKAIAEEHYIDRLHCELREKFLEHCTDCSLNLPVALRSQREDWIQSLIGQGLGVSVVPKFSLLSPTVDSRPIKDTSIERRIVFSHALQTEQAPGLQLLIDSISEYHWAPN